MTLIAWVVRELLRIAVRIRVAKLTYFIITPLTLVSWSAPTVHLGTQSPNSVKAALSNVLSATVQSHPNVLSANLLMQSITSDKSTKTSAYKTVLLENTETQLLCCASCVAQPVLFVPTLLSIVPLVEALMVWPTFCKALTV